MTQENPSNKNQSRKPYIIVGALFIYMCIMAVYNIDTLTVYHDYLRYFGTLGAEIAVLVILLFVLRRRERLKRERLEDLERASRERANKSDPNKQD